IADKLRATPRALVYGEDERMARVPISLVRRDDFDRGAFKVWMAAMEAMARFPEKPTVSSLTTMGNVRHVLSALWAELSVDARPSEGADFARSALKDALSRLY